MIQFDIRTSMKIQKYKKPLLTKILLFITKSANGGCIWIMIAACMIGVRQWRNSGILFGEVLAITAFINNLIIKSLVMRKRPCDLFQNIPLLIKRPVGSSFPSGHTAVSFACALTLCTINIPAGIAAFIWAALIGFTRIYFFVHFPTDVFFGIMSGVLISSVSIFALSIM